MSEKCIFCNLQNCKYYNELKILETQHFFSVFDPHPVSPGHALIIPKKHTVSLLDLNQEQWQNLQQAITLTIKAIEETNYTKLYEHMIKNPATTKTEFYCNTMLKHLRINKKPEGYNIGNNEGEAAGRTIHHLHLQIIPRYKGDIENATGGIRRIIPKLGDYTKPII